MNDDIIKGKAIRVAGSGMETWGSMTGDWRLRAKGKAARGLGTARVARGKAKDLVRHRAGWAAVGGNANTKYWRTDVGILGFILAPILALVRLVVRIVVALLRAVIWLLNTLVNGLGRVAEVAI